MPLAMVPRLVIALTLGQQAPAAVAPAVGDPVASLKECDAVLADKKFETARACYEALRLQHPGTPEARDAERALSTMTALGTPAAPVLAPAAPSGPTDPKAPRFYVAEAYSNQTQERLRLSTWEKLDFGITAFLYGLSGGASLALAASDDEDGILPAMTVGALAYTGLSVLYVNAAQVDRGDLPLVLSIVGYAPVTAGLTLAATQAVEGRAAAGVVAGAGLLSLPLAYWAGASSDLDPGDTQLVRDAGYWGLVWGVTGALATQEGDISGRTVGIAGLAGLYGGLGLGLLGASYTDVSLERIRVSTWGGYGGGILGVLIAAGSGDDEFGAFRNLAIGSALGVLLTFVSTGSIDSPPPDARFEDKPVSLRYLEPALVPIVDREGRTRAQMGVNLLRGRF